MVIVRFTRHAGIYNPGEVAGFEAYRAEELVAAGVAVVVEPVKPEPEEKPNHRAVMPPERRKR